MGGMGVFCRAREGGTGNDENAGSKATDMGPDLPFCASSTHHCPCQTLLESLYCQRQRQGGRLGAWAMGRCQRGGSSAKGRGHRKPFSLAVDSSHTTEPGATAEAGAEAPPLPGMKGVGAPGSASGSGKAPGSTMEAARPTTRRTGPASRAAARPRLRGPLLAPRRDLDSCPPLAGGSSWACGAAPGPPPCAAQPPSLVGRWGGGADAAHRREGGAAARATRNVGRREKPAGACMRARTSVQTRIYIHACIMCYGALHDQLQCV